MAESNPLFLAVRPIPAAEQVGWVVRVLHYGDFTTPVAIIGEFAELQVGPELNMPGNGSIVLDLDAPLWSQTLLDGAPMTDLMDYEYLFECYEDGVLRFQFLGMSVDETIVAADGTRQVSISGPGIAHVLTWACVMPRDFPPAQERGVPTTITGATEVSYYWTFDATWPAMRIWLALLRAAQSRGTIGFVAPMFTDSADSAGQPWQTPASSSAADKITPEPGTNLLDLLNIHTGQDLDKQFAERTEWVMWPGFNLDVRQTIGAHREDQVVFFEAQLAGMQRTRARDEIANFICTVDTYGDTTLSTSSDSAARWHQREQLQNRNLEVTDPARRRAISDVFLEQRQDEKSQWTITFPYGEAGRRPFIDYDLGDWIGVVRARPTGASAIEAYRVLAIVVRVNDQGPTVELTLQSLLDQQQRELQKRLTTLLNTTGLAAPTPPLANIPGLPNPIPLPDLPGIPPGATIPIDLPGGGKISLPVGALPGLGGGGLGALPGLGGGGFGGDGSGGGVRVFIQYDDPGSEANVGDFWVRT